MIKINKKLIAKKNKKKLVKREQRGEIILNMIKNFSRMNSSRV